MRPTERDEGAVWRLLRGWAEREQERDPMHRRVTQGQMAELFGVSPQTLSTWKLCQSRMQMHTQLKVIKSTDISLEQLTAALAEDEPAVAAYVAARQADMTKRANGGVGNGIGAPAMNQPGSGPGLRAVAAGGSTSEDEIAEAEEAIAKAKADQLKAIDEMKKKRGKE